MRAGSDVMLEDEEYNFVLQVVRDRMLQQERTGQPLVLRVRRDRDDGDQMTVVLSRMDAEAGTDGRSPLRFATETDPLLASLPFVAELGPLLLQALALQVIFGDQRRRMAAPLEQEAVGRLQRMKLRAEIIAQLETDGQCVCSICQESFLTNTEVCRLPCGHIFDASCLEQWLGRTRTCPNCRFMLEDVDQQYKDVVAPVWWSTEKENEEEKERDQCNTTSERRDCQDENFSSDANDLYSAHNGTPISNHVQQQPQSPEGGFTSFQPHFRGYGARTSSGDVQLSETDNTYTRFPEDNTVDSEPVSYTPAPPSRAPQRYGGVFRARTTPEEETRTLIAGAHSFEPSVSDNRYRNESNSQTLLVEEDQTHQATPSHGTLLPTILPPASSSSSSSSSLITPPRGEANDSFLEADLLDTTLLTPSFVSTQNSNEGSEYFPFTHMPQVAPGPSAETRATTNSRFTQNSLPPLPRQTAVSGNARHAVYALRRHRVEEVHGAISPTSNVHGDTISVGHPQRHRVGSTSRNPAHASLSPDLSLQQLSEERNRRRIGNNSGNSNGTVREEGQATSVVLQQPPPRGNRHNLAQYVAIIRRGQRRRH